MIDAPIQSKEEAVRIATAMLTHGKKPCVCICDEVYGRDFRPRYYNDANGVKRCVACNCKPKS
jgi:hypothetical protein